MGTEINRSKKGPYSTVEFRTDFSGFAAEWEDFILKLDDFENECLRYVVDYNECLYPSMDMSIIRFTNVPRDTVISEEGQLFFKNAGFQIIQLNLVNEEDDNSNTYDRVVYHLRGDLPADPVTIRILNG